MSTSFFPRDSKQQVATWPEPKACVTNSVDPSEAGRTRIVPARARFQPRGQGLHPPPPPLLWGLSKQLPSCLRHFREERNAYLKEAEFHVKTRLRPSCEGPAREGKHPFKYLVCIQNPLHRRPGTYHSLLTCLRNNADVSGVPERKPRLFGTPEPEAPVRPRMLVGQVQPKPELPQPVLSLFLGHSLVGP